MTLTVVRAVREAEATASALSQKLQQTLHGAMPMPPGPMDLPCVEQVLRMDFVSGDFAPTIPGRLL